MKRLETLETDNSILQEAGRILREGGLVAFPTETVYGLGADALNEKAAEKIYAAKGRPSDNPLIVHIAEKEALDRIAKEISAEATKVIEKYWPGPLTLIFEKTDAVPEGTTGGLDTVAVRMPSHALARALIREGGGYVAAPSANTSGRPSPTSAEHVREDLWGKVDLIIDGGETEIGIESTILDVSVTPPVILRPGAITKEMLEEVVGRVEMDETLFSGDSKEPPKAPGMKYRHYAPKAEMTVIDGEIQDVIEEINRRAEEDLRQGKRVGIIATEESCLQYRKGSVKSIGLRTEEATVANGLYRILREFDAEGTDCIYSEAFGSEGIGNAIMNRLLKAAGHHIIKL
ncbi:L-threonylcarbamoyladenylate synthase [Suipraeoptans intestinalis]|uniref:L-threonylcarbamoyladenylate synthase n=1 Tax=Suipraeoptans intestinalis TaxID=2606628 RepID=UPI0023F26FCA|nr:L-threonylcarbamoyladenylate synthase [Suipraeoptans intestinalis]MDD7770603.1 L-threonylcarbamoyladenylate synthase [Suipraeoptans intestinalis]MDY3121186.1 L-threonylcarbamoyladenylate synthase [Suipraeoptans intestinalis]